MSAGKTMKGAKFTLSGLRISTKFRFNNSDREGIMKR